jgi:hypothetical protein
LLLSALGLIVANFANIVCGFLAIRNMDVPLFLCFRRTSIVFVLLGDLLFLGRMPSVGVRVAVMCICIGALTAAFPDMESDLVGILWVCANNFLTATSMHLVSGRSAIGRGGCECVRRPQP